MLGQSIVPISIQDRILFDSPTRVSYAYIEPGFVLSEVPEGMEMLYGTYL